MSTTVSTTRQRLTARHDVMWAMVSDMPAVGAAEGDGYDVATGGFVLAARAGPAGRRRLSARRTDPDPPTRRVLDRHAIPYTTIGGSAEIRRGSSR